MNAKLQKFWKIWFLSLVNAVNHWFLLTSEMGIWPELRFSGASQCRLFLLTWSLVSPYLVNHRLFLTSEMDSGPHSLVPCPLGQACQSSKLLLGSRTKSMSFPILFHSQSAFCSSVVLHNFVEEEWCMCL